MPFRHLAILPLLACATVAAGQEPLPATPAPRSGPSVEEIQITENIYLPKINGIELGKLYQKFTGRRLIVSLAAATTEFSVIQKADSQHPISYKQASELVKTSALLENFSFVRDDKDPTLDALTPGMGVVMRDPDLPVYCDSDISPDGDAIISYVMTLKYVTSAVVIKRLSGVPRNDCSPIAAVPNESALVITDHTTNIRKFIAIKAEIDKPGRVDLE
jgi:hypothetical protein